MCTGPFRATDHNGDDAPECRSAAIANAARPVVGATRGAGPRRAFCGVFGASSRSTERKSVPPTCDPMAVGLCKAEPMAAMTIGGGRRPPGGVMHGAQLRDL